jgi:two-component system, NarL family, nitrate/nitrite response regulator NarL
MAMNGASSTVRIVIADDHQLFREALRLLLVAEHDMTVVGEAATAEGAVSMTRQYQPDILLLDVAMPKTSGLSALDEIAAVSKATRVIMVTGAIDDSDLLRALHLGARGFVLKESGATQLLESIRTVYSGEYYIGRECMADLVGAVRALNISASGAVHRQPDFGLTAREREIVCAIVSAYQNKEIAERFAISEKTVKRHLTNIFNKVGVSNRLELALFALHHHLDNPNL